MSLDAQKQETSRREHITRHDLWIVIFLPGEDHFRRAKVIVGGPRWGTFHGMFYGQEVELVRFFYWHVIHLWPISEDYDAKRTEFGGKLRGKKLVYV